MHQAIAKMKAPGDRRDGWLVIQIMITRACSQSCYHCTQGSNLAGKPVMMSLDEFETAVKSLAGFPGTIGVFGGQPTLHPEFPEICRIMREHVPYHSRGLWTNALNGHGSHCRMTYNPARSNINTHRSHEAYAEVERDWPEAISARREHTERGRDMDSVHVPPFVAIKDVISDEKERWNMIADCDINKFWSACIGVVPGRGLRGYFCELAYAQAALHANDPEWPDTGVLVEPGWWRASIETFEPQINLHCMACGIPLRRPGQLAIGGDHEEFSKTHEFIARSKVRDRSIQFVTIGIGDTVKRSERPSTEYLAGTTPGYQADAI
jgi:hypothetical protein